MKINPSSSVVNGPRDATRGRWRMDAFTRRSGDARQLTNTSAFTLIEIMIVVGIMAVVMAIGIPSVYQQMHKDSMRQALKDISDACMEARQRAILTGRTTEVRFRPRERTISVIEGASGESSGPSFGFHGEDLVEKPASGGAIFSAKLSEKIRLVYAEVNCEVELQDRAEFTCLFKPNGTCDLMGLVLRADPNNEGRKLVTDEVTGMIDWEVVP